LGLCYALADASSAFQDVKNFHWWPSGHPWGHGTHEPEQQQQKDFYVCHHRLHI